MTSKIHIYIYYNLLFKKFISFGNDDYKEEKTITNEVSIITDEKIVRNILTHPKTKTNEYGEFIDYDYTFIESIVINDMFNYKEKTKMDFNWNCDVDSFYYLKCELVKDISNQIENFINNI